MILKSLSLLNFRNYHSVQMEFDSDGAVLSGHNGAGKTNVFEAIYLLCTGRSQRGATKLELVRSGEKTFFIEGVFHGASGVFTRGMGCDIGGKMSLLVNGQPVASLAKWFGDVAVVALGPDDISLVNGTPAVRRRFIDMVISQADGHYLETLMIYRRILAQRNALLSRKVDNDPLLETYEEQMAESGAFIYHSRAAIVEKCAPFFAQFYREICNNKEEVSLRFSPQISLEKGTLEEWKNVFYSRLKNSRKKDCALGFSTLGPHRDDLGISIQGKPADAYASQGQSRAIAIALRLCGAQTLRELLNEPLIFLVDDALSDLDPDRAKTVYPMLESMGQLFIASPFHQIWTQKNLQQFLVEQNSVAVR